MLEVFFFAIFVPLRLKVFAACANFSTHETSRIGIFLPPRRKERHVRINIFFLAAFAFLRLCSGHALREIPISEKGTVPFPLPLHKNPGRGL